MLNRTQSQLERMNRHYVVATKNLCSRSPEKCRLYAENWGRILLIVQSRPEIFDNTWRQSNPTINGYYMGNEKFSFQTEELFQEFEKIYNEAMMCNCINKLIVRSNDGKIAEDTSKQLLIE
jgi:hypothetical protein